MRTLFTFIAAAFLFVSCSNEPVETNNQQQHYTECGVIKMTENTPNGYFIYVKMSYMNDYQRAKYQVFSEFENYKPGKEICDFSQLVKQPY